VRPGRDILKELAKQNVTVFVSTHTLSLAEDLCDRIGVISKGTLLAEGTVAELNRAAKTGNAGLEDVFLTLVREG
jgi:ABC-2 type transport system ATP-binding protein